MDFQISSNSSEDGLVVPLNEDELSAQLLEELLKSPIGEPEEGNFDMSFLSSVVLSPRPEPSEESTEPSSLQQIVEEAAIIDLGEYESQQLQQEPTYTVLVPSIAALTSDQQNSVSTVVVVDQQPCCSNQSSSTSVGLQTDCRDEDRLAAMAACFPYSFLQKKLDKFSAMENRQPGGFGYMPFPSLSQDSRSLCGICNEHIVGSVSTHIRNKHFKGDSSYGVHLIKALRVWMNLMQYTNFQFSSAEKTNFAFEQLIETAIDLCNYDRVMTETENKENKKGKKRGRDENDESENQPKRRSV